jgi:hypothetical protein
MRKLTITYLEKMISKVLKENLGEKAETLVSKIKSSIKENSEVCEQCGGNMNEGECMECGYNMMEEGIHDVEDINNSDEFDYVQEEEDIETEANMENKESCKYHMDKFGPDDDRTKQFCGDSMNESLKGRQKRLDRNKNNKIDAEDFEMLRNGSKSTKDIKKVNKISKTHGMEEGKHFGSFDDNEWIDDKDRIFNNDFDFDYDEEEFNDYPSFKEKHPDSKWFGGKDYFDTYKKHHNRPLKVRSRKFETDEGNAFSGALVDAKKSGKDSFEVDGKEYPVKESVRMNESDLVNLIEKIILEQKSTKVKDVAEKNNLKNLASPPGLEKYKQVHKKDGKENEDSLKAVAQKMKDYLKDGSKGEYETNPKIFPKGNGELAKMNKKAYIPSDAVEDYIDNFTAAALENLDYDEIHPNEEWVTGNIEGSSKTGNNPDWANTGESDVNKKRNKIRKDNMLAKLKRMAYNKSPQPVVNDKDGGSKASDIMTKLESTDSKKAKQINEEFNRMKSLIGYNQKTQ